MVFSASSAPSAVNSCSGLVEPPAGAAIYADNVVMATPVRVLIADDHPLIRSGLRALLEREGEFKVVAEAADGYEAIELALQHKPDLILLDVAMPRLTGTDAAQHISEKLPSTRIVIVSMHSDESYVLRALKAGARGYLLKASPEADVVAAARAVVLRALKAGARGYLLKASPEADVVAAARAVAAGNAYFSPSITRMLVEDYMAEVKRRGVDDSYDLLSLREKEILQLLVAGKSNREIAGLLHVSVATVETHRTTVFRKLNVHSLPELILYAVRKGLVT